MQRIVKFKNSNIAASVKQHLYRVTQGGDRLIFSNFKQDEAAFNLAVALEGLTREDYSFVGEVRIPKFFVGCTPRMFRGRRAWLEFNLETPSRPRRYDSFRLGVLLDGVVQLSDGYQEYPLAIDTLLVELIRIAQESVWTLEGDRLVRNRISEIMSNLERASLKIEISRSPNPICELIIHGVSQTQEIRLHLTDVVFSANYDCDE